MAAASKTRRYTRDISLLSRVTGTLRQGRSDDRAHTSHPSCFVWFGRHAIFARLREMASGGVRISSRSVQCTVFTDAFSEFRCRRVIAHDHGGDTTVVDWIL